MLLDLVVDSTAMNIKLNSLVATLLSPLLTVITLVHLSVPCKIPSDPSDFVCSFTESGAYTREGGLFKEFCGGKGYIDCSTSLKFNLSCNDNLSIYWSGNWISPLYITWKCNVSGNFSENIYTYHKTNTTIINPLVIPAPRDYSSCKVGGCYKCVEGGTFLAEIKNCVPEMEPEIETYLETTSRFGLKAKATSNTLSTEGPGNKSGLITLTVLPVVVLVLTILTIIMGSYILRQSCSRNHKRIKPQKVFPQGINVFDASFEPVSVELRIKLSESQESIYYSLDHQYEQISPTSQEKFAHSNFQHDSMVGDDGYSVVKEMDITNKGGYSNENFHPDNKERTNLKCYCPHVARVECDDSSGFVSTGFDYVDTRDCSDGNMKLQHALHNDPDCTMDQVFYEMNNNKIWPEIIEPMVNQDAKEEADSSPANDDISNLETDVFYDASDSDVDIENPLYEIEYMEGLCLAPLEDSTDICMQQHSSSESDLSSHYIDASGVIDHCTS